MTYDGDHDHHHPEVKIGRADSDGVLEAGMKVLLPCPGCGETARDGWSVDDMNLTEMVHAFNRLALYKHVVLYHWTPTKHRKQIIRRGLVPGRRTVTHPSPGFRAPALCFGDTPRWAWALSGKQRSAPAGEWDLWSVYLDDLTEPYVMPTNDHNGIHEYRTPHRVLKRHLWLVGTRIKEEGPNHA